MRVAFLPRHGRGHKVSPSEINYRANIAALKMLGATDVLSISAVGGLKQALPPGTVGEKVNAEFKDGVLMIRVPKDAKEELTI